MEASISSNISKPSPWKRKKEVKNLKRSEKIELVAQIGDLISESNAQLRQACWYVLMLDTIAYVVLTLIE